MMLRDPEDFTDDELWSAYLEACGMHDGDHNDDEKSSAIEDLRKVVQSESPSQAAQAIEWWGCWEEQTAEEWVLEYLAALEPGAPANLFGAAVSDLWNAAIHAARAEHTTEIYQICKALNLSVSAMQKATEKMNET